MRDRIDVWVEALCAVLTTFPYAEYGRGPEDQVDRAAKVADLALERFDERWTLDKARARWKPRKGNNDNKKD